jgi:hypothetical protein
VCQNGELKLKPKIKPQVSETEKDVTLFLSAPEISIFVACCVMVNELRGLRRSSHLGDITKSVFQERFGAVLERLSEAAEATQRFDVLFPVMARGHFSPFFWRWFNWWDDYLKPLSPSQVAETERRAREQGAMAEHLWPRGHWVDYRPTPAISFETA